MFALESKKKKVVQTFCPTTVGISSDIGKLCSANVQSLTVIFRPQSTILWNPHILCMNMYDENQAQGWSTDQVHESGPWTRSMDQVHGPQGGPWTGSTGVVHGPGSMFCIRPEFPSIFFAFSLRLYLDSLSKLGGFLLGVNSTYSDTMLCTRQTYAMLSQPRAFIPIVPF